MMLKFDTPALKGLNLVFLKAIHTDSNIGRLILFLNTTGISFHHHHDTLTYKLWLKLTLYRPR